METDPLVYLQSLEDPALCFITMPILAVDPGYRLTGERRGSGAVGSLPSRQPRIGEDVLCLTVLSIRETGPTANLLAPIVVNLRNRKAVQAVAPGIGLLSPACADARRGVRMLVMSRRQGETILIGDDIEIVIAHIGRSRVKVGIRAPRQMPVIAREVKLVRDENLAAAAGSPVSAFSDLSRICNRSPSRRRTAKRPTAKQEVSEMKERISPCLFRFKPT